MANPGLPKLQGGLIKREREAWQRSCKLKGCEGSAAGLIDTLAGPQPICEAHIPRAKQLGYVVRRPAFLEKLTYPTAEPDPTAEPELRRQRDAGADL
jgi:hypothetical protein